MKSIFQDTKQCFVCETTNNLHSHHIFYGTANRQQSEKYGLKVWLCAEHHVGGYGVHGAKGAMLNSFLREMAQKRFEEEYGSREEFIRIFGKSYL